MNNIEQTLLLLAKKINPNFSRIEKLQQSGSSRQYFRILMEKGEKEKRRKGERRTEQETIIGVFNEDVKENNAFFSFTNFFLSQKINVPKIITVDETKQYYFLEDLGDETLFTFLTGERANGRTDESVISYYQKVLQQLPLLQLSGKKGIDFSVCYPRAAFDKQSMLWDLNYFKYYFLKLANIPFDEQLLEDDFHCFINFLLEADSDYFMFRDFQSRNIMLHNGEPYFIDYQGGRKGALQYDVASLLFDGKADLPPEMREELLEYYLEQLQKAESRKQKAEGTKSPPLAGVGGWKEFAKDSFYKYYYGFVLIRILQALG
ncbi:MAG: phosphotransferase, partial [Bacteroidales bacterium]|nr:phosphotransferase [Bacteroidales bacterium]